jgi:hypothetical protein
MNLRTRSVPSAPTALYIIPSIGRLPSMAAKMRHLGRIDREREVGIGMRSIDQNGGGADS